MKEIKFNPEQQVAVEFKDGAMGVVAGAGSGKSTVLLGRINNLIRNHNIPERSILAISFTKNTALELENKLKKMGHKFVNVGTFHGICGKILHKEGIHITGHNLIKDWQIDNCFKNIDKQADSKEIASFISYQKSYGRSPSDNFIEKRSEYSENELRTFYKAYEEFKNKNSLYDFDDYLLLALEICKNNPGKYTYDYILVDEHQDSNLIQNELLKEWCQTGNIFTLFDFRQAIYSFRGGTTEYSMNFDKYWDDAIIHNIHINYRSPKNIVEQSNHFIRQYYGNYEHYIDAKANTQENGHIEVSSHFSRDVEAIEVVDKIEELIKNGEKLNEIAVIYRLNSQADFIEAELKRRKIKYDIVNDSSFFKRKEITGILSMLRLIHNPKDDNAFEGVFKARNYPLTYFSNKVFNKIQNYAKENDISLFEASMEITYDQFWQKQNIETFKKIVNKLIKMHEDDGNVISLISEIIKLTKLKETITKNYMNPEERQERLDSLEALKSFVKGNNLEQFIAYVYSSYTQKKNKKDAVQLMSIHRSKGLEFNNVFLVGVEDGKFPHDWSDLEEEARLFYVAVTRPKKNLYISEIGRGNRFIREYGVRNDKSNDKLTENVSLSKGLESLNVSDRIDAWIKINS